jgi:hypothetical protein
MNHDDYDDLIGAYLDGELSQEQAVRFQAWLDSSPENMRRYLTAVQLHVDLYDARASLASTSLKKIDTSIALRWWRPAFAAAASLIVCILGYSKWSSNDHEPFLAVSEGDVRVLRNGQMLTLLEGSRLREQDTVYVGNESIATIGYRNEATEVTLDALTELKIDRKDAGNKMLELVAGGYRASVARQPTNLPLMVKTPTADGPSWERGSRSRPRPSKRASKSNKAKSKLRKRLHRARNISYRVSIRPMFPSVPSTYNRLRCTSVRWSRRA